MKCIWWAIENSYSLVYLLFEFAVEWICTIRNKAEIIFSSKNHLHYCNCWQENNKSILCVWGYCALHPSLLFKLNTQFYQLGSLFSWNSQSKWKKLINNYIYFKRFFKDVIDLFCCQGHLKHFSENYGFCRKSGNDTYSKGWRGVMLFASLWRVTYVSQYVAYPLYLNTFVTTLLA